MTSEQAVLAIRHVVQEHGDEETKVGGSATLSGIVWFGQLLGWQWPQSYLEVLEKHDGVLVQDAIIFSFLHSFECFLFLRDDWQELAFWPVATDGCGNYYALSLNQSDSAGECPVVFFEMMQSQEEPSEVFAPTYAEFICKRMMEQCEFLGCSALQ